MSAAMPMTIDTALSGYELLNDPLLNKGTAFSDAERDEFELHGLLPPYLTNLHLQVERRLDALREIDTDLRKYVFLRGLQDTNETLFYALLARHIEELMPIVYTPTVGLGCQQFSRIFRKPRGLFLSYPIKDRIHRVFSNHRFDGVEVIVVSDGERILGLGDQGAGGMGIPIGKLSLYTACAGLHPATTLPILLDTGTDNRERLADPVYVGWRHERVRGADYDAFIEQFVIAVERRWSHVLLQWEDFARANAGRMLERYRDRLCTFNDDIQGTAAVTAGTLLAATRVTATALRDQTFVLFGAGTAGCGIGRLLLKLMIDDGVPEREARRRFFAVDRDGLLVEGMADLQPFQAPFVQPRDAVAQWTRSHPDRIDLLDVVKNAPPTVLIGVSGQPGMFTEDVVRAMASAVDRPVIFPLSNPVSRSEATPADLLRWTNGRAPSGPAARSLSIRPTMPTSSQVSVSVSSPSRPAASATICSPLRQRRWPASRPLVARHGRTFYRRCTTCARSRSPLPRPSPARPAPKDCASPSTTPRWTGSSRKRCGNRSIDPITERLRDPRTS